MSSLAAARADNFYYPKDFDPKKHGTINKMQGSHPLGVRAKKIHLGILVIRFEVPFHIRCTKCDNMIAKGVRFNAEKQKIGKFHSTTIYEFKMNCHLCSNKIVCKTDPEHCDYIFTEGANRILRTENATDMEFIRDKEEIAKVRTDPMARLENEKADKLKAAADVPRLDKIIELQDRNKDDFALNSLLRKRFRTEKKVRLKQEEADNQPKNFALPKSNKLSTMDLIRAKAVKFRSLDEFRKNKLLKREKIRTESIFKGSTNPEIQALEIKKKRLPVSTQNALKEALKQSKDSSFSNSLQPKGQNPLNASTQSTK